MKTRIITINRRILWVKVWAIAAMQGAITLTWVLYKLYLPLLLVDLGLAKELAIAFLIVENALESFIEPIFGAFSDQQQKVNGSRIPIISLGAILSSVLLITIPVVTIFGSNLDFSQGLFIFLTIAWASTMAVFRAPAMALLGRSVTSSELLPQAASILTLVGGIVGAFRFDVYGLIVKMGAGFAFAIGSFALLGAAALLRGIYPPEIKPVTSDDSLSVSQLTLGLIFLTGISISWGFRFLITTVNQVFTTELGDPQTKLAMTGFFLVLGLAALPAGKIANQLGNSTGMMIGGWGIVLVLLTLLLLPDGSIKVIILFALAFLLSFILNGVVPFALSVVPKSCSGLGVGMYFGGFGGGMSLFDFVGTKLGDFDLETAAITSSLAFAIALLGIKLSSKTKSYHP